MKHLVIDRYEGKFAICEDGEQKYYAIELQELPQGAKEGIVIEITDDGTLRVDLEETEQRRQRILDKQRKAFGG